MVKTRRKNYVLYDEGAEKHLPISFSNKKTSTKPCRNKNLLDFPTEILMKIASYLSFDSIKNLRITCRRLNNISIALLTETTKKIIAQYREFVKFTPLNLHPDIDACCILQSLCLLEKDMNNCKKTNAIFFPITIQMKAMELLNLMAGRTPANTSLKEEFTKDLVHLIHKVRCANYYSTLRLSSISNIVTKTKLKHKPVTYP